MKDYVKMMPKKVIVTNEDMQNVLQNICKIKTEPLEVEKEKEPLLKPTELVNERIHIKLEPSPENQINYLKTVRNEPDDLAPGKFDEMEEPAKINDLLDKNEKNKTSEDSTGRLKELIDSLKEELLDDGVLEDDDAFKAENLSEEDSLSEFTFETIQFQH